MKRVMVVILTVANLGLVLGQGGEGDPLREHLYPPELIMRNQRELGLDEGQRDYIVDQIRQTQSSFTSIQWQLQKEVQDLSELLEDPAIGEEELVGQLDRVLDLERQVKRSQLLLAVRIKNRLTEGQRATLSDLRRQGDEPGAGADRRRQPRRRARPGSRDIPAFR